MINVLLLIKRYSGNYPLLNEMVKLDTQRFRVVVCYLNGRNDGENELERLVSRCDYLETPSRRIKPANFTLLKKLRTIIDQEKIDVINCHLQRSIAVGVLAARLADCRPRVVATLHGLDSGKNWKRQIGNRIWYRFLDKLIGVSNAVAADLRQSNPFFPSERIVTVRNGLNLEHMRLDDSPQQLREKILPGQTNEFWFGTLGRLSAVKNQECLIRAFARVAADDDRVRLLLAGRGELEEHLKNLAQEMGVSERVTFLGFRRDVPQILNALDVFLLPSLREGLPLSLLEAMAAGRPVIASRVGGIPEIFDATEMGCLVEPASLDDLAAAMLSLSMASNEERMRLGDNARARALGTFSARQMIAGYEEVYTGVVEKPGATAQDELNYQLESVPCGLCGSFEHHIVLRRARELYNGLDAHFDVVKCANCGFVFTNPRPTAESLGCFYPDSARYYQPNKKRILAETGFKPGWRGRLRQSLLANYFGYELPAFPRQCDALVWGLLRSKLYTSHLPRWVSGGRLLDVGCAWGGYLWRMQQLGWEVHGVELNDRAAAFAQQELGLTSVSAGSINNLDYPEDFFDVVHLSMVLEHVPDPLTTLNKLSRLLKDNGQLILSVPDIEGVEARLFREKSYTLQVPQHLSHFSPTTIRDCLESAGFVVERVVHQRTKSDFVKSAAYLDDSWFKRFLLCAPVRRLCLGPLVSLLAMMGRTSRMSVYTVKRAAVR
jgi:glycosyltransferase involved in cell wall biosynthesis/2-polyprenyl-3-methyl-5-hydroxy-6-metoxy-1,4-benzoquinol methylase